MILTSRIDVSDWNLYW